MNALRVSCSLLGLAAAGVLLAGCGGGDQPEDAGRVEGGASPAGHAEHEHPSQGPHGGDLFALGGHEYHAELLHDKDSGAVTVYLLDGDARETVAGDESEITMQLFLDGTYVRHTLSAGAEKGKYAIDDASLAKTLGDREELKGRLQVKIDGKSYTGQIEHAAHDHAGHDHDDHDHIGEDDSDHDH